VFSEEVFVAIRSAWEADQNHPHRNRLHLPIPSPHLLKELVESAFLASLRQEEGRGLRFALGAVPVKGEDRKTWLHGASQEVAPFSEYLPLNAESISKLAPACDPSIGALLVDPSPGKGDAFRIWGIMYYGPPLRELTEIPVHIDGLSSQRPDVLTITVTSPGSMFISRGYSQIGRFVFGQFYPAQPTPFVHRALGQYIDEYLGSHSRGHERAYCGSYLSALEHLLGEIGSRGHGGTVVLVRDSNYPGYLGDMLLRYKLQHTLQMPEAFEKLLQAKQRRDIPFLTEARAVLRGRLDFVAQLACADGALLLRDELIPIAFGVTLQAEPWTGDVAPGPSPFPGQELLLDLQRLGTRHNSAADFVAAHQGSIAFVISQDGPIRAFLRSAEGPLLYWADCTLSMFV
jgi:hypothetical protein